MLKLSFIFLSLIISSSASSRDFPPYGFEKCDMLRAAENVSRPRSTLTELGEEIVFESFNVENLMHRAGREQRTENGVIIIGGDGDIEKSPEVMLPPNSGL
jgi:hypothetical protein